MYPYIGIQGTWGSQDDPAQWWHPSSAFAVFLCTHGFDPLDAADPFRWSVDLNGAEWWRRIWWRVPGVNPTGDHADWQAGGHALRYYIRGRPSPPFIVLAYSHGGQLPLFAAAQGQRIPVLVTVATPVRDDMREVVAKARLNIGFWLHIHATLGGDLWQWLGSWGDGRWSAGSAQPAATINAGVPLMRHSRVVEDPSFWPLWIERGWFDLIRHELTPGEAA